VGADGARERSPKEMGKRYTLEQFEADKAAREEREAREEEERRERALAEAVEATRTRAGAA
jgi:hypothetical protein